MTTSSSDIVLTNITQIFRGASVRSVGGEFKAVDNVSFTLSADPPGIVSLVGQSGSGKSTIARIILGLQKPTEGSVTYRGKDIYKLSAREYDAYRQEIQPVFQDPYGIFNPFYRVDRVFWTVIKKFKLARNRQQALAKIEESLHAVDLRPEDVLNRYPHQLSGGQRQRVMLARVHLLQPKFIIADEPISMLDAAVRVLFLNILIDFQQKYGMTTLFITHDLSTAYYVGGKILVMSKGEIVERGDIDDVLVHPTHPYTQMLLSSIPIPDPDARWQDKTSLVDIEGAMPIVALPDMEVPR
ncbi:ABC transporter ATP-binding protein [Dictyobacter kobayashii]|uniref:ABC transporter ATP-binding protein n=1 Tax=Dictyobacter kobayashii TaxID=2014872 RepID=A0A402ATE8_9CHLR|nr:ABC transporter ATP-binding protein [Dictyobacter kobayashii]GCE22345.1 ABC transporter ATP-binding protein [Dictyobacter kobayashii]